MTNTRFLGWRGLDSFRREFDILTADVAILCARGVVVKWTKRDEAWRIYGVDLSGYYRIIDHAAFQKYLTIERLKCAL